MKVSQGIQSGCHPYLENRIQTSKHRLKSYEESEKRKHNESEENPSNDRGTRKCSTSQKRHKNRRSIEFTYNAMYVKENSKPELQNWFCEWRNSCRSNKRLSKKGRRADALALRADERRDKLRKASGSRKQAVIRRYLNGETRHEEVMSSYTEFIGVRREPGELKHLSSRRKRKQHVILEVAASETGRAQTSVRACWG